MITSAGDRSITPKTPSLCDSPHTLKIHNHTSVLNETIDWSRRQRAAGTERGDWPFCPQRKQRPSQIFEPTHTIVTGIVDVAHDKSPLDLTK